MSDVRKLLDDIRSQPAWDVNRGSLSAALYSIRDAVETGDITVTDREEALVDGICLRVAMGNIEEAEVLQSEVPPEAMEYERTERFYRSLGEQILATFAKAEPSSRTPEMLDAIDFLLDNGFIERATFEVVLHRHFHAIEDDATAWLKHLTERYGRP